MPNTQCPVLLKCSMSNFLFLLLSDLEMLCVCVCVWGGVFPVCPELDSWRLAPTLSPSEREAAELHSGSEVESP